MQQICPVCNGLAALSIPCPDCGKTMEDRGHASDFFGPYSPYEEVFLPWRMETSSYVKCTHFLKCPACGRHTCRAVSKITV